MIPKIIHYCWFGGKDKPKLALRCIESWKKYCPDYKIIEWNESNFDVNMNAYTKMCYDEKKWAFLSDYVRLWVVHEYGGIYFDTDVEIIKSFDSLLKYQAFFGFETKEYIATGLGFGAEKGHLTVCNMLHQYELLMQEKDHLSFIGCPILNTTAATSMGLQKNGRRQVIEGAVFLPMDYLNPYNDSNGKLSKTTNTMSIHWFSKSALPRRMIIRSNITRFLRRIFGDNCLNWLKRKKEND